MTSLLTKQVLEYLPPSAVANVLSILIEKLPKDDAWLHPETMKPMVKSEKEEMFRESFIKLMQISLEDVQDMYMFEQEQEKLDHQKIRRSPRIAAEGRTRFYEDTLLFSEDTTHPQIWENQLFLAWALFDRKLHGLDDPLKYMIQVFTFPYNIIDPNRTIYLT